MIVVALTACVTVLGRINPGRSVVTIPHPTLGTHITQSLDDSRLRWQLSNEHGNSRITHAGNGKSTITIEGGSSTGDTSIGSSDLNIAITAHNTDTESINDSSFNRGGGGGGGGLSCGGGQSPPTLTVGKTLLNTSANLLPITTASDTFNNLKNLVKIDKSSSSPTGNSNASGYRSKGSGGYKSGGGGGPPNLGSPTLGEGRNISNGPAVGRSGASGHFSAGFNKNSVKIRQHDSDVSPRPRRSYQSDSSSSSRYYTKNSDILGQSVKSGGPITSTHNNSGRQIIGESSSGRGSLISEGPPPRRNYQSSDGGYNRNLNSSSSSSVGSYRQQDSRYENSNEYGQQQRQYGTSSNAGYNNYNKSYNPNVNSRPSHRDYGSNNYRDYEDSPRPRYTGGNGSNNNTNSLERSNNSRYKSQLEAGGGNSGPSASDGQRQSGGSDIYERSSVENRAHNNRSPPIRSGGNVTGSASTASSSINSSLSRGISPNSSAAAATVSIQHSTPSSTPPPQSTSGRWVPPSLRPQHGLSQSEKNDAVFRKVRGILNKLTPEKFQELSDDLLKLDLNSIVILNGVILLIFDKALDEPKYSSMYAQLCKRLSEEAPSFEKDPNSSCTFLRLLIAVCRDRFNNRLKRDTTENDNNNQFNKVHKPQGIVSHVGESDADEEERRHLAKQRMLGNVKFIGELNKLDMLSKNVLHQCIMELLEKKKKRSATSQEMCEDMECLAQLLKTCGKNLDSEQGKELMNQYFEKLERRSKSPDYPPRIRFMLKDVIELRENNWVPRKVGTTDGPVPIKQIRTDDDAIMRTPFANRNRDMRNNDRDGDSWMNRFHLNLQPGYNDMFRSFGGVTGASPIMSPFGANNSNRPYNNSNNRERNTQGNNYNNRFNKHNNNNSHHNQNGSGGNRDDMRGGGGQYANRDRDQSNSSQFGNNNPLNSKELAPRFKRNLISTNQDPVENLQMRPAANSLLFKAASQNQKMPNMLPISTPPSGGMQSKEQLSSAQYPLLGTPISHLANPNQTNPARPSSTPSAEYEGKVSQSIVPNIFEKGLKATSSSPNFGTSIMANDIKPNGTEAAAGEVSLAADITGENRGDATPVSCQLVTKQGSFEKSGATGSGKQQKKDKAFNKEEILKKLSSYMKEKFFYEEEDEEVEREEKVVTDTDTGQIDTEAPTTSTSLGKQLAEFIEGFLELKVPEKCMKDACLTMLMDVLDKADEKYFDRIILLLHVLRKQNSIKSNILLDVFKQVINKMNEREALNPRIATHVASLLAKAVCGGAGEASGLLKLNDIASYTDNGQHYPLFLLVLQQLHKSIGKEALEEKFRASKIDLMSSLSEVDRNKERLAEILDDRNLAFLYPLLKVQAEMLKQITMAEGNPTTFYKWIKANVDAKYYKDPGFITALMTVLLKFITQETSLTEGSDIKKHPDKTIMEKEEKLLHKYCQILQTFLGGNTELQLIALYALQVFCYNENFPKGMLCRWFKYLYEAEVIEEETFIIWKEEISDKYPGKGTALFQVNNWLTWLQEAESEDDDE